MRRRPNTHANMPYMTIFQIGGKWHRAGIGNQSATRMECGVEWPADAPAKKIGGGREHGCVEDPPDEQMCPDCFPWCASKKPGPLPSVLDKGPVK